MTTLAIGQSAPINLGSGNTLIIATNGGFGFAVVTPSTGPAQRVEFGPAPYRGAIGPFPGGAVVNVTNTSCGEFDYSPVLDASGFAVNLPTVVGALVSNGAATILVVTFSGAMAIPASIAGWNVDGHQITAAAWQDQTRLALTVSPAFVSSEAARTLRYYTQASGGTRTANGAALPTVFGIPVVNQVAAQTYAPELERFVCEHYNHLDLVNGAISTWSGRATGTNPVVQGTASAQPTRSVSAGVLSDGTDSLVRTTFTTVLRSRVLMPTATKSSPIRGFTCTGMTLAPDGSLYVGNHGLITGADLPQRASLVHMLPDGTLLDEISLFDLGFNTSVQGVAYDTLRGAVWCVDSDGNRIVLVDPKTGFARDQILLGYKANGIAYVPESDSLWVNQESTTSTEVKLWSIQTKAVTRTDNISGTIRDMLQYDRATKCLLQMRGPNGSPANLDVFDTTQTPMVLIGTLQLPEADANEGFVWDSASRTIMVANDAYYHSGEGTAVPFNQLLTFDVQPLTGTVLTFWGVFKISAVASTKAFFSFGSPNTNTNMGFGLRYTSTTAVEVTAKSAGAAATFADVATGTSPDITSPRMIVGEIDLIARTIVVRIDGVQVASLEMSKFVGQTFSPGQILRMFTDESANNSGNSIYDFGYALGDATRGKIDLLKVEGYLPRQGFNGLTVGGNLPGGHPYKVAIPSI